MTEEQLQAECFKWHWNKFPRHRRCLFHVPNGGYRNKREAMKFKSIGVVSGVADFVYSIDGRCIFIELKTDIGKQSGSQMKFLEAMGSSNYKLARSLEEFQDIINNFHEKIFS